MRMCIQCASRCNAEIFSSSRCAAAPLFLSVCRRLLGFSLRRLRSGRGRNSMRRDVSLGRAATERVVSSAVCRVQLSTNPSPDRMPGPLCLRQLEGTPAWASCPRRSGSKCPEARKGGRARHSGVRLLPSAAYREDISGRNRADGDEAHAQAVFSSICTRPRCTCKCLLFITGTKNFGFSPTRACGLGGLCTPRERTRGARGARSSETEAPCACQTMRRNRRPATAGWGRPCWRRWAGPGERNALSSVSWQCLAHCGCADKAQLI